MTQRWTIFRCFAVMALLSVTLASASEPERYRLVVGRKVDEFQDQLQKVAAQGYQLIDSCTGVLPMFRTRSAVFLLLESLPPGSSPPEYLVVAGSGWLETIQEAGTQGFRIHEHGILERGRQAFIPAPYPGGGSMEWTQAVFILERSTPAVRMEYAVEPIPRDLPAWPALDSRVAEGYRILKVSGRCGAILAREEGAQRSDEIEPGRFTMVSSLKKKKLATKIAPRAEAGFRFVARLYSVTRGGSHDLLFEQVAEPGRGYEYRIVPFGKEAVATLNEWGAEGFRAHPSTWWIMERKPDAQVGYEYRWLEAKSTDDLTRILKTLANEEHHIRTFCSRSILVETQRPLR